MALTTEQQARLDSIDARLAAGITSAALGDRRTDYDLDALRQERDRLLALQATGAAGSRLRRVVFSRG